MQFRGCRESCAGASLLPRKIGSRFADLADATSARSANLVLLRDLEHDDAGPYIDVLGRSTGPERGDLTADDFVAEGARHLEVDVADLTSRTRQRHVVEARRLLLALGRERWGQKANELGRALGKKADTISYLAREGIRQRLEDEAFARRYDALDKAMVGESR